MSSCSVRFHFSCNTGFACHAIFVLSPDQFPPLLVTIPGVSIIMFFWSVPSPGTLYRLSFVLFLFCPLPLIMLLLFQLPHQVWIIYHDAGSSPFNYKFSVLSSQPGDIYWWIRSWLKSVKAGGRRQRLLAFSSVDVSWCRLPLHSVIM